MEYKKYYRKTSLKQKGVGSFFLDEVLEKKPKTFLEIGVFHGVTARNVCELLFKIHRNDFNYIGLDLFEESDENKNEVIPNTTFSSNPVKQFYYKYIKRQNPYSLEAVEELLAKFKNNINLNYLFPFRWVLVGLLGILLDLVKAPGYLLGGILASFIRRSSK